MRLILSFSAILSGLASVGCASTTLQGYQGPARSASETALVRAERTPQNRLAAKVQITSIDSPRGDIIPVSTLGVSLLPGEVCVGVLATTSTMDQETAELCFYALAGLTYEIRVLVAGVERDLVDDSGTRHPAQRGPL